MGQTRALTRDPRAASSIRSADAIGFEAFIQRNNLAMGNLQGTRQIWTIRCHESDDPVANCAAANCATANGANGLRRPRHRSPNEPERELPLKAFYNAARNYFTGVVTFRSNVNLDLPPFYTAVTNRPRPAASAPLIFGGIDGKGATA
jgi:hypothetical protein